MNKIQEQFRLVREHENSIKKVCVPFHLDFGTFSVNLNEAARGSDEAEFFLTITPYTGLKLDANRLMAVEKPEEYVRIEILYLLRKVLEGAK